MFLPGWPTFLMLLLTISVECAEDPSPSSAISPVNRLQFHHYFDATGYKLFIETMRLDPNYLKLTIKGRTITLKGIPKNMKPIRVLVQDFDIPRDYKVNLADIHANYTSGLVVVTASNDNEESVRDIKIEGLVPKNQREMDKLFKKASNNGPPTKRLKSINLIG